MKLSKKTLLIISALTALLLLVSIFKNFNYESSLEILKNAKIPVLFIALLTLFIELILKALRIGLLLKGQAKSSFAKNFIVTLVGLPFGLITPGRAGDLVKVYTLSKKTSLPIPRSLAIGVLEKIIDFTALFLITAPGVITLLFWKKTNPLFLYMAFFITILSILVLLLLNKNFVEKIFRIIFEKNILTKHKDVFKNNFDEFYSVIFLALKQKFNFAVACSLAIMLWINRIIRIFLIACALGLPAQFFYFLLFIPVIETIEIMPVAFMGFGTREYAYIFLLSAIGITKESSVTLSLVNFFLVSIPFAFVGYLAFLKEHIVSGDSAKKDKQ